MHVSRLLPGRAQGEILPDRAVVANAGDVVITVDRSIGGLDCEKTFGRSDALLSRITLGFLLETHVGIAPHRLSVGMRPAGPDAPTVRYDASIPVAVDVPAEGATLQGLLEAKGWCQLSGGGLVAPIEFRVDGHLVNALHLKRTARPDVAAVIPGIGDVSAAGYEVQLDGSALTSGPHALTIAFQAEDGRIRVSNPVRFLWLR
jgi:hypothetical protein